MIEIKGYLANHESPLDGGAFSIRHRDEKEFVDWLRNETKNGVTVVLVEIGDRECTQPTAD